MQALHGLLELSAETAWIHALLKDGSLHNLAKGLAAVALPAKAACRCIHVLSSMPGMRASSTVEPSSHWSRWIRDGLRKQESLPHSCGLLVSTSCSTCCSMMHSCCTFLATCTISLRSCGTWMSTICSTFAWSSMMRSMFTDRSYSAAVGPPDGVTGFSFKAWSSVIRSMFADRSYSVAAVGPPEEVHGLSFKAWSNMQRSMFADLSYSVAAGPPEEVQGFSSKAWSNVALSTFAGRSRSAAAGFCLMAWSFMVRSMFACNSCSEVLSCPSLLSSSCLAKPLSSGSVQKLWSSMLVFWTLLSGARPFSGFMLGSLMLCHARSYSPAIE
mmetsp:Transcript_36046/g.102973  ORF Transcript_36046/g.102973 Transcript_36046/m.102973 type:complete len:328 (+) Transcript_36046:183-1166(+)